MEELVAAASTTLDRLGFGFKRNESKDVVELEVSIPVRFTVRITHLPEVMHPSPMFGMLAPRTLPEATDFAIVDPGDEDVTREKTAEVVRGVLASLKRPPWVGLGFVPSMTSKAMWSRAAQGKK